MSYEPGQGHPLAGSNQPDGLDWRTRELLVRLDEKVTSIDKNLSDMRATVVTQAEFKPVRMAMYGLIAILLTGVVGAMLNVVLTKH